MRVSDRAEEILESLWSETIEGKLPDCDIAVIEGDPPFRELANADCVRVVAHKATLTEKGHDLARGCVRRHRLAERLLADVLLVKKSVLHETGCGFEHFLHEGIEDNICTLLGHPRTCPHGRPIPDGDCCRKAHSQTGKLILPLTEVASGQKAVIAYLHTENRDRLQKLLAIGALPQTRVTVLQRKPTVVLEIGKSQFAIDEELASHVHVRRA